MGCYIIISGCSGGGKSTLISALRERGERVIEEPGRRIVRDELARGGALLPWLDPAGFARRAIDVSIEDLRTVEQCAERVFFDRGLVDAAVALAHVTGESVEHILSTQPRFHRRMFLAPPWAEIFASDAQRPHGFDEASSEYERLAVAYPRLGYEVILLPKVNVNDRADFVLSKMSGV